MLCLIEFSLKEAFAWLMGLLGLVSILAVIVGYFVRGVRKERSSVKDEVIGELQKLGELHKGKIAELSTGLEACKREHAHCERKINGITAFNLRLQARETLYQKTINRLEHRLGIELTDFSDVSQTPEDPDFG